LAKSAVAAWINKAVLDAVIVESLKQLKASLLFFMIVIIVIAIYPVFIHRVYMTTNLGV
jgi:hypothetical protein